MFFFFFERFTSMTVSKFQIQAMPDLRFAVTRRNTCKVTKFVTFCRKF